MTEPEEQRLPGSGDVDSSLILAAEIRRLLPALKEIATSLKAIEAALAPSGYASSVFEALRQINLSTERIRMAAFDKPLTREECEALEGMFPEKAEEEK
jgi:hypothetical protein